ncbi:LSU ribosomal protein L24p (L26e) [hydrothermal vent metagenome]|uniref:LSU ribosomal protein L24p (L26e) n=1 Tax=hydrothermal vent metagenome TaxID=652676 RepID=A0A3B0RFZ9_9ZZZZ
MAAKIKKGDNVIVLAGKDKGRKGEVLKVVTETNRAIVSGLNMVKRHTKPTQYDPGGIKEQEASLHMSNLAIADPKSGEVSRVGFKFLEDGKKVRFAKKSGEVIDG